MNNRIAWIVKNTLGLDEWFLGNQFMILELHCVDDEGEPLQFILDADGTISLPDCARAPVQTTRVGKLVAILHGVGGGPDAYVKMASKLIPSVKRFSLKLIDTPE